MLTDRDSFIRLSSYCGCNYRYMAAAASVYYPPPSPIYHSPISRFPFYPTFPFFFSTFPFFFSPIHIFVSLLLPHSSPFSFFLSPIPTFLISHSLFSFLPCPFSFPFSSLLPFQHFHASPLFSFPFPLHCQSYSLFMKIKK